MLRKVRAGTTDFAKTLYRNLCYRILQRRGLPSRLARCLTKSTEKSVLDKMLDEARSEFAEVGEDDDFADPGDMARAMAKFHALGPQSETVSSGGRSKDQDESSSDEFDHGTDEDDWEYQTASVSAAEPDRLMAFHQRGRKKKFPEALSEFARAFQPTSVPAERSFTAARYAGRACQEIVDDERFEQYMLLKNFLAKNRPWEKFLRDLRDEDQ